ncbi:M42 family metallopeptidase [Crassaminicella profunda]|uniref:M42 family metallopeptidase n=1 Tax=Crassaminicella profunda TaxID=1286698 RepID=UPI001CA67360|nr:M42 family metallopeptidase [Crassaminicella profunda]QZY55584.1 M42 family metallopeptidase [Crassaminicella profunda]
MDIKQILKEMIENPSVSGFEYTMGSIIETYLKELTDDIKKDKLGNLISYKKGNAKNPIKIMLAAHMDEIGLMVKDIDKNGFIKVTNIGGVDQRTLLAQEVMIHGKEDVFGVVATKAPHLQTIEDRKGAIGIEDLLIDIGMTKEAAEKVVCIGDAITIHRKMIPLLGSRVAGKALDDKAGIAAMIECFRELKKINHACDIYGVATVQEEVGTRGAMVSTFGVSPHIGIAIDVGFGKTPELSKDDTIELGKGPGITLGGNIHPKIHKRLKEIAKEYNIPFQIELSPGNSGTDAQSMQITQCGIATGVLSIPLRYMHTSVETIDLDDIKNTGRLLAYFIASLDDEDLEGFLCF